MFTAVISAQSLQDSLVEVIETNPLIQERLHNYQATQTGITQSQSDYYPKLDLNLGGGYEQTKRKDGSGNTTLPSATNDGKFSVYQNSLVLTQNLFRGLNTYYSVEEQKLQTFSAAYSYVETTNTVAYQLTSAYIDYVKNKELIATAQENVKINKQILEKVQKLYDSGLTTLSEVKRIQSSLALAESNLVVQQNTLLDSSYKLQNILGKELSVDDLEKPKLNYAMPTTKEDALAVAMKNNPSLLVSSFNIKQLTASKKAAQSAYYPVIDLVVTQNMNKNLSAVEGTQDQFQAMAYFKYNIFRGFADKSTVELQTKRTLQEVDRQNKIKREIIQNLNLAWASQEKLQEQLKYLKDYKTYAEETLRLNVKEYALGRRSLLDLLSAQNDFIRSKAQIITTKYNLLSAQYRILNTMGILVAAITNNENLIYSKVQLEEH